MGRSALLLVGLLWLAGPARAQKPSASDTAALIEKSRQTTLAYSASLPDFVCTEVVTRYRLGGPLSPTWWRLDKLTVTLSYFRQHEEHQLAQVNGKPTTLKYDSLVHGATSEGEFGSILRSVFDPASQASFSWERSKSEQGRRVAVFAFEVPLATSHYYLENLVGGTVRGEIVGYHGTVDVDSETGQVVRLAYLAEHIPGDLKLTSASTTVDYAAADIAGRSYLLPARSEMEIYGLHDAAKNQIEFRGYEKFEASSSIDFGSDK